MNIFETIDEATDVYNSSLNEVIECAWCGGEVFKRYKNKRGEIFCRANCRTASNRALKRFTGATQ